MDIEPKILKSYRIDKFLTRDGDIMYFVLLLGDYDPMSGIQFREVVFLSGDLSLCFDYIQKWFGGL